MKIEPKQRKFAALHFWFFDVLIALAFFAVVKTCPGQTTVPGLFQKAHHRRPALLPKSDRTGQHQLQYLWAGANQYQLWFQPPERIEMQLDTMAAAGLKVLRIFLHAREFEPWEDPPDAYTFENPIGNYHDSLLEKVDYLMVECQKRGIKMIITLENRTEPYLSTFGPVDMYRSPQAIQAYKNRFTHFLNHRNALLNKLWKEIDDTILAWEIQNEPGVPLIAVQTLSAAEKHQIIRKFLNELAAHLKRLDPGTYVSLGIAGYARYYHDGASGDDIRTLGDIKDANIYSLHYYGGNLQQWIDDNLEYVRSLGKLLFVEEFGNERKDGMAKMIENYRNVTQLCRHNGIPWMFWRLGHRKDEKTWSIMADDPVWQKVISPEAHVIARVPTADAWNANAETGLSDRGAAALNSFRLYRSFPNPIRFSASEQRASTISFHLPRAAQVELGIFDITGRRVASLVDGWQQMGMHRIKWRIGDLPAGLYFCRLRSGALMQTQKIVVVQ